MADEQSNERDFNFWDYYFVLVKRKRVLLAVILLGLVLTSVVTYFQVPLYRATTTVLIERESPVSALAMGDAFVRQDYFTFFTTQYRLIRSKTIARRVVNLLNLTESPLYVAASVDTSKATEADKADLVDRIVGSVQGGVQVNPIQDTNIVEISFLSPNPEMAAQVANALAEAYIDFSLETRYMASEQASKFLTSQIEELRAEVESKQKQLQNYLKEKDIFDPGEGQDITNQRLVELNQSYTEAQTARIRLETYYNEMKKANPESIAEVQNNELVIQLKREVTDLEGQYARMSKKYKPDWPEMVRLRSEIEKSRHRLGEKAREIYNEELRTARTEFESALENERSLNRMLEDQKGRAFDNRLNAIQYNALLMEVESKSSLLQSLLQRHSETNIASQLQSMGSSNLRVVDKAEVPGGVFKPNKKKNLALGFMLSLFCGVGVAFLLEYMDRTIKSSEDVTKQFGLPALGVIPSLPANGKAEGGSRGRAEKDGDSRRVDEVYTICHRESKSLTAEAYRSVRTALLLSGAGEPPRVVVVTSPAPGEGKTATSINMSISLAQLGKRVLLIDTDLRRPRIHRALGLDGKMGGLSHYLAGMMDVDDVVREHEVPGLYIITAGPIPPDPSELISSKRFGGLLEKMLSEGEIDHIILDSPPILSVADPIILGAQADGVMLVIHGGVTTRDALSASKEKLDSAGVRILGVVTNNLDIDRHGYYYYYPYYRYRYRYRYGYHYQYYGQQSPGRDRNKKKKTA